MGRQQLTDAQCWVIVSADPSVADRQLADELGLRVSTIHAARWRLRRQGWTCAVRYVACRHCSGALTRQGRRDSRREYHHECRTSARQAIQGRLDQGRWERMPPERRNVVLDRLHDHEAEHQTASQRTAAQHFSRWTPEEEAMLVERAGEPAYRLAHDLGRTLYAVRARKWRLRERGLLD